ncbi:MAG: alpha/beta fold hydrolase [Patescibacteria group bacterium]|jgi:carboxylesterase
MVAQIRQFLAGENKKQNKIIISEKEILQTEGILNDDKAIFFPRESDVGVLLLHSYTSTPYEFCEMAKYLAEKGLTVYAPTLAGHGTSPADLAKTTIEDWQRSAEDAYLFLKQQSKKVFVVGSSFGGNLAFHLATKFFNPLSGVISMGTPIKVRRQKFYKIAIYTFGWFLKNKKKRRSDYKFVYINHEQIVYPVMPIASLRRLFKFIKKVTIPNLKEIKAPCLIIQSSADRIVNPSSAQYLHEHLGSTEKRVLWVNGNNHALAIDEKRGLIFKAIYRFILES